MLKSKEQKEYEKYVKSNEDELAALETVLEDVRKAYNTFCDKRLTYLTISKDTKITKDEMYSAYLMCEKYSSVINDLEKTKSNLELEFRNLEDNLIRLKGEAK